MYVNLLLIAIGGALGSVARYLLSTALLRATGTLFPIGTFAVNLVGCIAFGAIAGAAEQRMPLSPELRAQHNERGADDYERQRVAGTPAGAEPRGLVAVALVRDEGRYGGEMIGLERVSHTEQRTESGAGDEFEHGHERRSYCILSRACTLSRRTNLS